MSENIENENEIMDEATVAVEATEVAEVEEAVDDEAGTAAAVSYTHLTLPTNI